MTAVPAQQRAIILFGHGARDPQWAGPMQRMRAHILTQPSAPRVELAFLELMAPTLDDCVATLVADGIRELTVVPIFLAQGGHLKRDLPVLLARLREAYPQCSIDLVAAAGEAEAVVLAMAEYALQSAG